MKAAIGFGLTFLGLVAIMILSISTTGNAQQPGPVATAPPPAQELNAAATLLFSADEPHVPDENGSILSKVRRVTTLDELHAALASSNYNLVIVDESAFSQLSSSTLLYDLLKQGTSLMGINVALADLQEASRFRDVVRENAIKPEASNVPAAPARPDKPFYSIVRTSGSGSSAERFGYRQTALGSVLFNADVMQHSAGVYEDLTR